MTRGTPRAPRGAAPPRGRRSRGKRRRALPSGKQCRLPAAGRRLLRALPAPLSARRPLRRPGRRALREVLAGRGALGVQGTMPSRRRPARSRHRRGRPEAMLLPSQPGLRTNHPAHRRGRRCTPCRGSAQSGRSSERAAAPSTAGTARRCTAAAAETRGVPAQLPGGGGPSLPAGSPHTPPLPRESAAAKHQAGSQSSNMAHLARESRSPADEHAGTRRASWAQRSEPRRTRRCRCPC
mmetsp:Transcript_93275/g.278469  ORF Transcript_93275/g.278469 Transcript_93275/m.278469 type:complete len:238 (-) Transcript_93275:1080-1793(-)